MELDKLINIDIESWVQPAKTQLVQGQIPERIPLLAVADPNWFAVHISCLSGKNYSHGDKNRIFPLMSIIKPFSFLYLLEHCGAEIVLQWVGVKPSAAPFNYLSQLVADGGYPRNPMINSGAITLADKLPGTDAFHRTSLFCQWLNQLAGCQLHLDQVMLTGVVAARSTANVAIAEYLHHHQRLENLEIALETYEQICCLSGTVEDLASLGKLLAAESESLKSENRQIVNDVMLTCGLYQASSEWIQKIGLPMKSGISGGLLAVVPNQGAIACYSPPLDSVGNSVVGLALMEAIVNSLG